MKGKGINVTNVSWNILTKMQWRDTNVLSTKASESDISVTNAIALIFDQTVMKRHKLFQHEGARISCEECNYQSRNTGNMKIHKQSKHEGKRPHCEKCEMQFVNKHSLVIHVEKKHQLIKWYLYNIYYYVYQSKSHKSHNCNFGETFAKMSCSKLKVSLMMANTVRFTWKKWYANFVSWTCDYVF